MENKNLRWVYLATLALIWGSSFILMKRALLVLSPIQVGALRTLFTAIFLILIGGKKIFKIKRRHWYYLTLNGFLGTFFPAFLFAFAIDKIDSSIASILNSLTPLNTLIFGALVFGFSFRKRQLIGVLIGLIGTLMLILKGAELNPNQDYFYASFILIASIGYALNVNILKKYLFDLDALSITVANFVLLIIPTLIVLWFTNFFESFELNESTKKGMFYLAILAVFGTGLAKIMFNRLIQISTPIFSSSVTYLIPIVAITWGILDGEKITLFQVVSGAIIMFGVYLVNKSK
ncbi:MULTISPECIES: DMT family transporter [Flavobacteriaceae]|uniref:Permease n=2 Tax=Flavobacteriaceae TaxID=49546 RepID=A0A4Y8AR00_9FLAO|nr:MULTISPECIES: EamA family transporter [Flavobacteriaceae]TEW72584.1 permease [Gramella jeungdoensis]GGK54549.1 permease [Lutibacter litoralis]